MVLNITLKMVSCKFCHYNSYQKREKENTNFESIKINLMLPKF